jgi:hypothetical protein
VQVHDEVQPSLGTATSFLLPAQGNTDGAVSITSLTQ